MAITREAKEKQLADLTSKLVKSQLTIVCDYRGLSVEDLQQLRATLAQEASGFKVMKKTLIKKALTDSKLFADGASLDLEGQLGLAFGYEDEVSVAQVISRFSKEHPALEVKSAISSDGAMLSTTEVQHLASLPSKPALRGLLVGTIAAPLSGLVRVLEANLSGLVRIVSQIGEQKAQETKA